MTPWNKGLPAWNKGRSASPETRARMAAAKIGNKHAIGQRSAATCARIAAGKGNRNARKAAAT